MRKDPRQRRLEEIGLGEVGPADAFPLVRDLLSEDAPRFAKRVYLMLREVVWRLVADRASGEEAASWLDVCGRASVLMDQGGAAEFAHRVTALTDMVERTARFLDAQPVDEVLGRRHVPETLRSLAGNSGRMGRAALLAETGLGQSNLSRLLAILEGHGLVRRSRAGREAELWLTDAGQAAVARLGGDAVPMRPEFIWQARGIGVSVSDEHGALVSANAGFEEAVGTPAEVAVASAAIGSCPEDIGMGESRWVRRFAVGEAHGGTACVWVDVSDLHLGLADAEKRASTAEARVAALREALGKAEAATAGAERRLHLQQLSVEAVRERAVGRLGTMAKLVHERFPARGHSARQVRDSPYQQIVAIKDALNNLLDAPASPRQSRDVARGDGRVLLESLVQSACALTDFKIDVLFPDWLRAEKANYAALVKPLRQLLLLDYEVFEMSITRDEHDVVVHGTGCLLQGPSVSRTGQPRHTGAEVADAFKGTWAGLGVDVYVEGTTLEGRGLGFRMSVPRHAVSGREGVR